MWFDEEINLVIETDPFVNVSGATSFSQIDNVTAHITEQPIIISLSENYAPVQSVNGQIGFVVITKESLGITGGLVTSGDLSNYATIINLASTGSTLSANIASTGSTLATNLNSLSGFTVLKYGDQTISGIKTFISRPRVNGTGVLLSGEIPTLPFNLVYTDQDQFISGQKIFLIQPNKSFWVDSENLDSSHGWLYLDQDYSSIGYHNNVISFNDSDIQVYGITNFDNFPTVNGIQLITGVDLSAYATTSNLELTGSTLQTNINNLSITYATISNLATTGSTLQTNINTVTSNLATTGSTLQTNINTVTSNLATTGSTLQTNIDSLSGVAVLIYGNQIISGTKRFNEDVYIKNLYVTGTETIVNTTNFNVQSPYLILNLTGGAVDGGIFFVTGSGLTGINDYGPIIGFDHSKNFKFGVARRSDDLSTLNDIAAIQDITNYSGFVDNKYYPRSNPSGYVTKSNGQFDDRPTVNGTGILLSGEAAQLPDTIVYTTGNNVISGDNTFYGDQYIFSGADIIVSGGTFNLDIRPVVNGTGVLLSGEAAQLPETIVYTTNDQSITGLKTFRSGIRIGEYGQTSTPTIQIFDAPNSEYSTFYLEDAQLYINSVNRTLHYDFGKYPTGTTQTIAVIKDIENYTGFATITNLALTGSTLNTNINNLSGNSVLVFENQTISGQKRFVENDITSNFPVSLIKGGFSGPGIYNFIQRPEYRTIVFPNPSYYYSGIGLTGVEIYFNTGTSRWWYTYNNILQDASPQVTPNSLSANLPLNNWSGGFMRIQPIYSHNISHYTDGTDPIDPHLIGAVALTGNQTISGIKTFATGIDIVNGTSPQSLRIFNSTGTNSGEFGIFGWQATGTGIGQNALVIGTQATQSGILRDVVLSGRNIRIPTGDLYIGTTGAGTSRIYFANPVGTTLGSIIPNQYNLSIGGGQYQTLTIDANYILTQGSFSIGNGGYLFAEGTNRYIGLRDSYSNNDTIGTNNQGFNIYKIYSGTTNNFATREFLTLGWTGTTGIIGTTIGQSGTLRNLILTGSNILMKPSGVVYFYDNNFIFNKNGTFSTTSLTNGISEFALNRGDNGYMMSLASYQNNNAITFRGGAGAGYGLLTQNLYVIGNGHLAFGQTAGHAMSLNQGCDLFITRDAANILSQVNGTNAQQFRVYNLTGTNTGEFGLVGWQNNNFIVGAQRTQSGTLRDLILTGANVNIASSGIIIPNPTVPTSTGSAGTRGQISWDNDFIYVCVSGNSWKRSALTTW